MDSYASYKLPSHQADSISRPVRPVSPESEALASQVSSVHAAGPHNGDEYDEYEEASSSSRAATLVNGDQGGQNVDSKPSDTQKTTTTWKIHWRSPSLILAFLLAAITFALGHHFYYSFLDGTIVSSGPRQEWALRFGTAFASLTQACLIGCIGMAYSQRVWVTVKRKPMALTTLDDAFSLQTNILSFLSWELWRKAKVLCLLGLCAWCIPISSTITPATLSVKTGIITNNTETNVPCPDYSTDSDIFWANFEGAGNLDGPSPAISRLVAATLTSISILPLDTPFMNSSYTLTFYGPAFLCQDLASAVAEAGLNKSDAATLQDAWNLTMESKLSSIFEPFYTAASPEGVNGVNREDLLLFVNTNWVNDNAHNYTCRLWNTSYTVDFEFYNGIQSTSVRDLQHVAPVNKGHSDFFTNLAPGQVQYRVIFQALVNSLTTQLEWGSTGSLIGQDSAVLTSGLPACPEIRSELLDFGRLFSDWMCRAGSVPAAIEDLSHNVTLSLLSSGFLANETIANVTTRRSATFYTYNCRNLVMVYGISISATLVCAAVGVHALVMNGYSANASFSTILLTTRNEDLDYLTRGHCLGKSPMDKSLGRTMLRYGILKSQTSDGSKVPHAAFGLSSDVRALRKGEPCQ